MTIILTLGNIDQFIQVADRRITTIAGHKPLSEDFGKEFTFCCRDARLIVGFAGIASAGSFNTRDWLAHLLLECSKPDYMCLHTLDRLSQRASTDFQQIPALTKLSAEHRRLSIICSGYLYGQTFFHGFIGVISNFENLEVGRVDNVSWAQFRFQFKQTPDKPIENFVFIHPTGTQAAFTKEHKESLKAMLLERKPASAIEAKAVSVVRKLSEDKKSRDTIGRRISSVRITPDPSSHIVSGYHIESGAFEQYVPGLIEAYGGSNDGGFSEMAFRLVDKNGNAARLTTPSNKRKKQKRAR